MPAITRAVASSRSSCWSIPRPTKILGAQGVGESGVDKRIDVIATAITGGILASELADLELAYAPQFGSAKDPVNMLGHIVANLRDGLTETIQWHEVDAAVAAGATVLDVRTWPWSTTRTRSPARC